MITQCPKCSNITEEDYVVDGGCIFYFLWDGTCCKGCNYEKGTNAQKRTADELIKLNIQRKSRHV